MHRMTFGHAPKKSFLWNPAIFLIKAEYCCRHFIEFKRSTIQEALLFQKNVLYFKSIEYSQEGVGATSAEWSSIRNCGWRTLWNWTGGDKQHCSMFSNWIEYRKLIAQRIFVNSHHELNNSGSYASVVASTIMFLRPERRVGLYYFLGISQILKSGVGCWRSTRPASQFSVYKQKPWRAAMHEASL